MTPQRVIWITGASSGIGAALAQYLARQGNCVAATARGADALNALAAQTYGAGSIKAYTCDLLDTAAVTATVARVTAEFGSIDAVILNAGAYEPDVLRDFDADKIIRHFDMNVTATVRAVAAVLPALKRSAVAGRQPQLALMASVAGYRGLPRSTGYGGSKAALLNMGEAMRWDFAAFGIKLQVICPGFVKTRLTDKNEFPMPFLITPDQAAPMIAAGLASDRFEVAFPPRAKWAMKLLRLLPYKLYFPLVGKATGA